MFMEFAISILHSSKYGVWVALGWFEGCPAFWVGYWYERRRILSLSDCKGLAVDVRGNSNSIIFYQV
jgi:hypothetical protein